MYESPIKIIVSKLCTKLESDCVKSVQSYGFDVDKEELAKALNYDREQYEKGHKDGYNKAIDDFKNKWDSRVMDLIRLCEDCRLIGVQQADSIFDEIAEQLKEGGENDR